MIFKKTIEVYWLYIDLYNVVECHRLVMTAHAAWGNRVSLQTIVSWVNRIVKQPWRNVTCLKYRRRV